MAELVDEGKVRWIGVCNFDVELLARCHAVRRVDSLQPPLSLLSRGARAELVPYAREHGIGVIAYSPLASGLLSGSFDRARVATLERDRLARERSPLFQEPALSAEPRARRAPAGDRRAARHRRRAARDRLGPRRPGRDRRDRRRAAAAARGRLGLGRRRSSSTRRALAEIDAALAATGAGSDAPPLAAAALRSGGST